MIENKHLRDKHNLWSPLRKSRVVEEHGHNISPLVMIATTERHVLSKGEALVY